MVPQSAVEHYERQQRITAAALVALRRERGGPRAWAQVVAAFQLLAARDAAASVPLMLEEQGIDATAVATVAVGSVAGTASDGRPLDSLLSLDQAQSPAWFEMVAASMVQDAARQSAGLSIATRPRVGGWVRMLNPPSCSRCAILAGRFFRWNQGFQRHPRCDCRHIPRAEADFTDYDDARLGGERYFESLSPAEQDRIFTKAGAQAVRDGADLNQIVNARRGMDTIAFGNRRAIVTREGATSRGIAGRRLGDLRKVDGERYRRSGRPRVMPETIYAAAPSREEALRLLKLNGFIF